MEVSVGNCKNLKELSISIDLYCFLIFIIKLFFYNFFKFWILKKFLERVFLCFFFCYL